MSISDKLQQSLIKSFIDKNSTEESLYAPKLLVNEYAKNKFVLNDLRAQLINCQSFIFSVAFITESGLATLKNELLILAEKGVQGRIITSNYLAFNSPKIFRELLKLTNVEVRITNTAGFHTKGYLFDFSEHTSAIIGSSNLTASALKVNYEWNVQLNSMHNGEITEQLKNNLEELWLNSQVLTIDWILNYEINYQDFILTKQLKLNQVPEYEVGNIGEEHDFFATSEEIVPNKMQVEALASIQAIRETGAKKGLVISATGTGKTFLSAFDVKSYQPKRMLFIVHQELILSKAKSDFIKVLGENPEDFGILSGTSKDYGKKYLFATIQTISKSTQLQKFARDEFDYILIDEVHKAGAKSYLDVLAYFTPKFLMGMTATPERTDDFNIFELFDFNIAYEIRLSKALDEDMLCPFHYFGVRDYETDQEVIDKTKNLTKLISTERVKHVLKHAEYFGYSGKQLRGLIFCGNKDEAYELSKLLNKENYRTVALTSIVKQEDRIEAIKKLEAGQLDYILTVDIFNEGIDIPSVNQIIMLRATQSSIIFIQQLGRGLRKHDSKDFVTIIDFIGNYKNNYLIPVALSGDNSLNKNELLKKTLELDYLKGVSTINFDEISKKRIFASIEDSKMSQATDLRKAYTDLKNRVGKIPFLLDFFQQNSADPLVIASYRNNYYEFLKFVKEDIPSISQAGTNFLTLLTNEFLNGMRAHELILLDLLLETDNLHTSEYDKVLKDNNCYLNTDTLNSVIGMFNLSFYTESERKKYGELPLIELANNQISLTDKFKKELKNNWFKSFVIDIINVGLAKNKIYNNSRQLTIQQKYTRKDVCRLLNWKTNEQGTIFGYRVKYGTCPIFVTYHKDLAAGSTIDYADNFINESRLNWSTRSRQTLESLEVQRLLGLTNEEVVSHLFIQKSKGEPFFYFGTVQPDQESARNETLNGQKVAHIELQLEEPVDRVVYEYLKTN